MREIKFRAWYHGAGDPRIKGDMIYSEKDNGCNLSIFFKNVQNEALGVEVMQFTGLKDKNGKEIYEGDVNSDYEIINYCNDCMGYSLFMSKFNDDLTDYCMCCGGEYDRLDIKNQYKKTAIIGNVYENPELINN